MSMTSAAIEADEREDAVKIFGVGGSSFEFNLIL